LPNRSDFAIAEKPRQAYGPKTLLNQLRIVIGMAEKTLPAPIAAAKASAINSGLTQLLPGFGEQFVHILRRRLG